MFPIYIPPPTSDVRSNGITRICCIYIFFSFVSAISHESYGHGVRRTLLCKQQFYEIFYMVKHILPLPPPLPLPLPAENTRTCVQVPLVRQKKKNSPIKKQIYMIAGYISRSIELIRVSLPPSPLSPSFFQRKGPLFSLTRFFFSFARPFCFGRTLPLGP